MLTMPMPDFIRKAIEAQGKLNPDEVEATAEALDLDTLDTPQPVERRLPYKDDIDIPEPEGAQIRMEQQPQPITWEEFFTPGEVETTKRVRRGQQHLGPLARKWIAGRVGGTIGDGGRSAKQFVNTPRGKFRVSLSADGDNTTETAAHERMGARAVSVEDVPGMCEFFEEHDLPGWATYEDLRAHLREQMRQP